METEAAGGETFGEQHVRHFERAGCPTPSTLGVGRARNGVERTRPSLGVAERCSEPNASQDPQP